MQYVKVSSSSFSLYPAQTHLYIHEHEMTKITDSTQTHIVGLTAGVAGQQRMLTPPWHLILPSHLSKVRVALHSIL
jgi:hypothetical protein